MSQPTLIERQRLAEARRKSKSVAGQDSAAPAVTQPRRAWHDFFIAAGLAGVTTLILGVAFVAWGVDFQGLFRDLRALSTWFPR